MSRAYLDQILERLHQLPAPDRDVDVLLGSLWPRPIPFTLTTQQQRGGRPTCPRFTEDLNAPLALLHAALPGWLWRLASCCVSDDAWVLPDFNDPVHGEGLKKRFPRAIRGDPLEFWRTDIDLRPSGRPAIAFCIAIVTAMTGIAEYENG